VAAFIIVAMLVMAFLVWSNIRANAYEARALRNQEAAEAAVIKYWNSVGCEEGGYGNVTAASMQGFDPGRAWMVTKPSVIVGMDVDNLPPEYFVSTLIVKDADGPADELAVVSLSETGTVYYSLFREGKVAESLKLTLDELKARESRNTQTGAALADRDQG
jgi:hypothetical protein